MGFSGTNGLWAKEDFSDPNSITNASQYQGVSGGYIQLLPQIDTSIADSLHWEPISGWSFSNGLNTEAQVSGSFTISGGRLSSGTYDIGYQRNHTNGGLWEIYTPENPTITTYINTESGFENGSYAADSESKLAKRSLLGNPVSTWYITGSGVYDVGPNGAIIDSTDPIGGITGPYTLYPIDGKHSPALINLDENNSPRLYLSGISFDTTKTYTVEAKFTQYVGSPSGANISFHVAGYTGTPKAAVESGSGIVKWYDPASTSWTSTKPSAWITGGKQSTYSFSLDFSNVGTPTPSGYFIEIALSGTSTKSTSNSDANIIGVDDVNVYYTEVSNGSFQYIKLDSNSPNTVFTDIVTPGANPFTLEVDVASIKQLDHLGLSGYSKGNLKQLSPISGTINHGIYINNGVNWDYLEIRPDGIRSLNHPELALPIDLHQPEKIRIGIEGTSIYIQDTHGRAVVGLNQFDTADTVSAGAALIFGAPDIAGPSGILQDTRFQAVIGQSFFDNIKLVSGLHIERFSGATEIFSKEFQTVYTAPFEPGIPIGDWNRARIKYIPVSGGETIITPQYQYTSGNYIDASQLEVTLSADSGETTIDLSSIPVYNYDSGALRATEISRPINSLRFKVEQRSIYGTDQAPLVDSIEVSASKDKPILNAYPNWGIARQDTQIRLAINSGLFLSSPPEPDPYSLFFIKPLPGQSGTITSLSDLSKFNTALTVNGSLEVVPKSIYNAYRTYASQTSTVSGQAATELGGSQVTNLFPNPSFRKGFVDVSTVGNYTAGKQKGKIARFLDIDPSYPTTSSDPVLYLEESKAFVPGQGEVPVQRIYTQTAPSGPHVGIRIYIPSGALVNGQDYAVSLDIHNKGGDVLLITSTNMGTAQTTISANNNYETVTLKTQASGTSAGYVLLYANSTQTPLDCYIANINIFKYVAGYITSSTIKGIDHSFGTTALGFYPYLLNPVKRGATVIEGVFWIDRYPTSTITLLKSVRSDGKGVTINLLSTGLIQVQFDTYHMSFYNAGNPPTTETFVKTYTISSNIPIPLRQRVHLGFLHNAEAFRFRGAMSEKSQAIMSNLAATNKAYLTINGAPVAVQDTMDKWYTFSGNNVGGFVDANPIISYIPQDDVTVTVGNGLDGAIEYVNISRPPLADAEAALYIRGSKLTAPYFIPSVFLKPGHSLQDPNTTVNSVTGSDSNAKGLFTHSIYTLDNPGPYTNWDHGTNKNHLIFQGTPTKDYDGPYPGFGSTRFGTNSYAVAKYSSTLERLINHSGTLGNNTALIVPYPTPYGRVSAGCWVKPYDTGVFFELARDESNPTSDIALVMEVNSSNSIIVGRRNASNQYTLSVTGTFPSSILNTWTHVAVDYAFGHYNGTEESVYGSLQAFFNGEPVPATPLTGTKAGYGFAYVGNEGSSVKSALLLGRGADVSLADVYINTNPYNLSSPFNWKGQASTSGDKGGISELVHLGDNRIATYVASGWNEAYATIVSGQLGDWMLEASINGAASDELLNGEGFTLHTESPFKIIDAYYYSYDDSKLKYYLGGTDSPIQLVETVPEHGINIARIDSPLYSVDGAISTVNLANDISDNITSFNDGKIYLASGEIGPLSPIRVNKNIDFERGSFPADSVLDLADRGLSGASYSHWSVSGEVGGVYDVGKSGAHIGGSYKDLGYISGENITISPLVNQHSVVFYNSGDVQYIVQSGIKLRLNRPHNLFIAGRKEFPLDANTIDVDVVLQGHYTDSTPDIYWDFTNGGWTSTFKKGAFSVATGDLSIYSQSFTTIGMAVDSPPDEYIVQIGLSGKATNKSTSKLATIDLVIINDSGQTRTDPNFLGMNASLYANAMDFEFLNQTVTDKVRMTSLSVPDSEKPSEAFYFYFIGRGDYGVYVPDALPHVSAVSGGYTIDTWLENKERVKDSIKIVDKDGKPVEGFSYDIYISPYNVDHFEEARESSMDLIFDGTVSGRYSKTLPDKVFSVVLVSDYYPNDGRTIFINYQAYDYNANNLAGSKLEIYNPSPIFRKVESDPEPGDFMVTKLPNDNNYKNIIVYGMDSSFSGYLI